MKYSYFYLLRNSNGYRKRFTFGLSWFCCFTILIGLSTTFIYQNQIHQLENQRISNNKLVVDILSSQILSHFNQGNLSEDQLKSIFKQTVYSLYTNQNITNIFLAKMDVVRNDSPIHIIDSFVNQPVNNWDRDQIRDLIKNHQTKYSDLYTIHGSREVSTTYIPLIRSYFLRVDMDGQEFSVYTEEAMAKAILMSSLWFVMLCILGKFIFNKYVTVDGRDPLTHVLDQNQSQFQIEQLISYFHRYQRPFSIILIDIQSSNEWKSRHINNFIRLIAANRIIDRIRSTDIIGLSPFEHGSFAIILPEQDEKSAFKLASQITNSLSKLVIKHKNKSIPITVRSGVNTYSNLQSYAEFTSKTRQALFTAIQRNQPVMNYSMIFDKSNIVYLPHPVPESSCHLRVGEIK